MLLGATSAVSYDGINLKALYETCTRDAEVPDSASLLVNQKMGKEVELKLAK